MHQTSPHLVSQRVILRMGDTNDSIKIINFYKTNNLFLQQFSDPRPAEYYTEKFWLDELARRKTSFENDKSLSLFIYDQSEEIIGFCNFFNFIRGAFHACYLGYGLAREAESKGLMYEALSVAIPYVFEDLNLHRIMANYDPKNSRSGLLLKKLGFQQEGFAKNYLYYHEQWNDHVLTAITNNNWKPRLMIA